MTKQRTNLLLGFLIIPLSNHRSRKPGFTDGASPLTLVSRYCWKPTTYCHQKNLFTVNAFDSIVRHQPGSQIDVAGSTLVNDDLIVKNFF